MRPFGAGRQNRCAVSPPLRLALCGISEIEREMNERSIAKVHEDLRDGFIPSNTGVSINLSAESVAHKDIVDWMLPLTDFTQRYHLVIEVTETSLITQ